MAALGLRRNTECRLTYIDGTPMHRLNWVASKSRCLLELLPSLRSDTELFQRLGIHFLRREEFVVNSHPFSILLWLLMRVVAAPAVTRCLAQALYSEAVNEIVYRWNGRFRTWRWRVLIWSFFFWRDFRWLSRLYSLLRASWSAVSFIMLRKLTFDDPLFFWVITAGYVRVDSMES